MVEYTEASIAQHLQDRLTIDRICEATGAHPRTLRRGFQDRFGVTPKAYIKAMQLNLARKDLRRSDADHTTVTEIANRWVFWHLGQFAADFQGLFGELPSAALRLPPQQPLDGAVHQVHAVRLRR